MGSSVYRQLGSLFSKTSKSPVAAAAATTVKVESLVNQYKRKSDSVSFRRHHMNFEAVVRRLAIGGYFSSIHEILNHQKRYQEITDESFTVRLLCLYGQAKMSDRALELFEEMPQLKCPRTVLSFNALLAACVHSKEFDKAFKLFREIPESLAIQPDIVSYNTVIKGLCEQGLLAKAVSMLDELDKNDIEPSTVTFNTLLDAFYKNGRFGDAEEMWNLMEKKNVSPDLRSYNAKLNGLVKYNRVMEAVNMVEGLDERGQKPDIFTYNLLIKGFVNEGNLNEVKRWYKEVIDNGCKPDMATFRMLILFACDTGDIAFAHELCKKSIDLNRIFFSGVQKVINKLVEHSEIDKAKELMQLGSSIPLFCARMSMPTET